MSIGDGTTGLDGNRGGGGLSRRTVITALAVLAAAGALLSVALYPRHPRPAVTRTPAQPIRVTSLQAPPSGSSLLWFRDNAELGAFVLRATDWDGRRVGGLSVSCGACGVLASPDGQRLLIGEQAQPAPGQGSDRVFDSNGRLLSIVDGFQAEWADDSRHLCSLRAALGAR